MAYAQEHIAAHPRLGCRWYDNRGTCLGELVGKGAERSGNSRSRAKRDLYIGILAFAVLPLGLLIDRWLGWTLFLGMILGTKFVLVGTMKLADGIAGLLDSKPTRVKQ